MGYRLGQVIEDHVEYLSFAIWAVPKMSGKNLSLLHQKESLVELLWENKFHLLEGKIILNLNFLWKLALWWDHEWMNICNRNYNISAQNISVRRYSLQQWLYSSPLHTLLRCPRLTPSGEISDGWSRVGSFCPLERCSLAVAPDIQSRSSTRGQPKLAAGTAVVFPG